MATAATIRTTPQPLDTHGGWNRASALFVHAAIPLGLFGALHLGAEAMGLLPLFFTPFGLPHWAGAAAHLTQLALIGAACWAINQRQASSPARWWLAALAAAYIALPFVTPFLHSLGLAAACTGLFLLAAASAIRAGAVSRLAGWLLAPMLILLGLGAAMGLAVAAYAPPFALTQSHQTAAAS